MLYVLEKNYGPESVEVGNSLLEIGMFYVKFGKYHKAQSILLRSMKIREKSKNPIDLAVGLEKMAQLQRILAKYPEAEASAKKALQIYIEVLGNGKKNWNTISNIRSIFR